MFHENFKMFYAVLLVSAEFYDVSPVFYDVSLCFMMFHQCFMMFHQCCMMFTTVLQYRMFYDVSGAFYNVLWCCTMFRNCFQCFGSRAAIDDCLGSVPDINTPSQISNYCGIAAIAKWNKRLNSTGTWSIILLQNNQHNLPIRKVAPSPQIP